MAWNEAVYYSGKFLAESLPHHNFELQIDRLIPLVPWTVVIYFGCILFWVITYLLCAGQTQKRVNRFFCADFLSKAVCLVCFVLIPTTNIRPVVEGSTIWDAMLRFLYQIDAPVNLFPSVHCLVSWLCFIGVRGNKGFPQWYRWGSLFMALAVFVSTLTTRQHVLVDVAGAVVLAEGCWWLAGRELVSRCFGSAVSRLQTLSFWHKP